MKTFYASLIVFLLLLVLIVCNSLFVKHTTAELEELLSELSQMPTEVTALSEIENAWQKSERLLSLSVAYEELREFDAQLLAMHAATTTEAAADFEKARLLAIESLSRIRESEEFSIDNLI